MAGARPFGARAIHVAPVGVQQPLRVALDGGGHRQQRLVLGRGIGLGHGARGLARFAPDAVHVRLDVHRAVPLRLTGDSTAIRRARIAGDGLARRSPSCSSSSHTSPRARPLIMRSTDAACSSASSSSRASESSHRVGHQLGARTPDPRFAHQLRQCSSGGEAVLDMQQRARLLGEGPQHQRRRHAFAAQAFEHARRSARAFAGEQRLAQLEHVVARDVEHRVLDLRGIELAGREQQRELLHLLVRRQQIAFDAARPGTPAFASSACCSCKARRAASHRGRRASGDGVGCHHHAGAIERLEPGAGLLRCGPASAARSA